MLGYMNSKRGTNPDASSLHYTEREKKSEIREKNKVYGYNMIVNINKSSEEKFKKKTHK